MVVDRWEIDEELIRRHIRDVDRAAYCTREACLKLVYIRQVHAYSVVGYGPADKVEEAYREFKKMLDDIAEKYKRWAGKREEFYNGKATLEEVQAAQREYDEAVNKFAERLYNDTGLFITVMNEFEKEYEWYRKRRESEYNWCKELARIIDNYIVTHPEREP